MNQASNKTQYAETKEAKKEITSLRKEFNSLPEIKEYKTVKTYYDAFNASIDKKTPQGDISTIFAYMKMLDPGSVVREGEFATAQNAGGIPDKIVNQYNKALEGTLLNDDQRANYKDLVRGLIATREQTYNQRLKEYKSYVSEGGDPRNIGSELELSITEEPQQSGKIDRSGLQQFQQELGL